MIAQSLSSFTFFFVRTFRVVTRLLERHGFANALACAHRLPRLNDACIRRARHGVRMRRQGGQLRQNAQSLLARRLQSGAHRKLRRYL